MEKRLSQSPAAQSSSAGDGISAILYGRLHATLSVGRAGLYKKSAFRAFLPFWSMLVDTADVTP